MNRFRRLLIRWKKKVENHIAMLLYASAYNLQRGKSVRIGSKSNLSCIPASQHDVVPL